MFEFAFKNRLVEKMTADIIISAMNMILYFSEGKTSLIFELIEIWVDNTTRYSLDSVCLFLENNLEYLSGVF